MKRTKGVSHSRLPPYLDAMRWLFVFLALVLPLPAQADCVVLLHGLARTKASFMPLSRVLVRAGYQVVNLGYPSTEAPVEDLSDLVAPAVAACENQRVHFVTHSMGGILLRDWLAHHQPANPGRIVMLAPPNAGSDLVDKLGWLAPFRWINGPAGSELGTGSGALPRQLGPLRAEVGIIAGTRTLNPVYSALIPGADDGKVSVGSTRLPGMRDHLTVTATHTFIMNNPLVIAEVLIFLQEGQFDHHLTTGQAIGRIAALWRQD